MKNFLRAGSVVAMTCGALGLAACSSQPTCDYSKAAYQSATSVPSLNAPAGLSTPDRSASLVIPAPPPGAPGVPQGKGKCLDRPPSYFATSQHADSPADKSPEK